MTTLAERIGACTTDKDIAHEMRVAHYLEHTPRDEVALAAALNLRVWTYALLDEIVWSPAAFGALRSNPTYEPHGHRLMLRWARRWCKRTGDASAVKEHHLERRIGIVEFLVQGNGRDKKGAADLAIDMVMSVLRNRSSAVDVSMCERLWEIACASGSDRLAGKIWDLYPPAELKFRFLADIRGPAGIWRAAIPGGNTDIIQLACGEPRVMADKASREALVFALGSLKTIDAVEPLPQEIAVAVIQVRCSLARLATWEALEPVLPWFVSLGSEHAEALDGLAESMCLSLCPHKRKAGFLLAGAGEPAHANIVVV